MIKKNLRRNDLVYPDLSYQIIGILFESYNKLGSGHHEKYYQRAVAIGLTQSRLSFQQQVYLPIMFEGEKVGSYFLIF